MLGNFTYSNPTKIYFGEDSLAALNEELPKYGKVVQLVYGNGSVKENGIYDQVVEILYPFRGRITRHKNHSCWLCFNHGRNRL